MQAYNVEPMYNRTMQSKGVAALRFLLNRVGAKYLMLSLLSLLFAGFAVFFLTRSTPAQAFTCTSNPCPYDGNGNFVGYPKAWPPGCIYIIPGLPSNQSGKEVPPGSGHYVWNQADRNGSTRAPQCYPENVSAFGFTYFERGHRMFNVGTYIDKNGCAQKYKADGSPAGTVCFNQAGNQYGQGTVGGDNLTVLTEEGNFTIGWIDEITSDGVLKGWAYDSDALDKSVEVHVYADGRASTGRLITSGKADKERADVNELFKIEGMHGFEIKLPDSLRDGKPHTIFAYGIDTNGGQNRELGGGGKTFTGTGTTGTNSTNPTKVDVVDKSLPVGWLDNVSCVQFTGWALDQDNPTAAIGVHFYKDFPAGNKDAVLLGALEATNVQRDDVNKLYNTTGKHGFNYRFASVTGNPLADGKRHLIYAYAINSNGGANVLLGGAPKTITCAGTNAGGGGGGGGSSRHNYLTPCNSDGLAQDGDPGISVEIGADGKAKVTIDMTGVKEEVTIIGPDGKPVKLDKTLVLEKNIGDIIQISYGGSDLKFTVDTTGMKPGDTMSNLVPMPCIRIGYNDVLGGQQCGEGEGGTCANKLHVFCGPGGWQNNALKDGQFKILLYIKGTPTNIPPWREIDYIHDDNYASKNAIQVEGSGTVYCKTAVPDGDKTHYSLVATKTYDVDKGEFE
ncbi:MAG: hypothetical protein JNK33_00205 [Candidatus Doudnabacteria bacterium]|nr:hypothetical protein [Candidatus Doudnabacteria bacterium]